MTVSQIVALWVGAVAMAVVKVVATQLVERAQRKLRPPD